MACQAEYDYDEELAAQKGIVKGHAYTIFTAREVQDANGDKIRLIKLRNPWGTDEWVGDWCDSSSLWTDELKEEVGFEEDEDDGIFWMDFNDFKTIFGQWMVNKYLKDAKFNYQMMESKNFTTQELFLKRY